MQYTGRNATETVLYHYCTCEHCGEQATYFNEFPKLQDEKCRGCGKTSREKRK